MSLAPETLTPVFIGLGSNLGNRRENIASAIDWLKQTPGVVVEKVSAIIETEPCGGPEQGKYLNCAAKIKTNKTAEQLLVLLQEIENNLKRVRRVKNGPRTIDLDILLFGSQTINLPHLKVSLIIKRFELKGRIKLVRRIS